MQTATILAGNGSVEITDLSAGTYAVEVSAAGFQSVVREVDVFEDQEVTINLDAVVASPDMAWIEYMRAVLAVILQSNPMTYLTAELSDRLINMYILLSENDNLTITEAIGLEINQIIDDVKEEIYNIGDEATDAMAEVGDYLEEKGSEITDEIAEAIADAASSAADSLLGGNKYILVILGVAAAAVLFLGGKK